MIKRRRKSPPHIQQPAVRLISELRHLTVHRKVRGQMLLLSSAAAEIEPVPPSQEESQWQPVRRRTRLRLFGSVWGEKLKVWVQRRGLSTAATAALRTPTSARPSESAAPTSASRSSDARFPDGHKHNITALQEDLQLQHVDREMTHNDFVSQKMINVQAP